MARCLRPAAELGLIGMPQLYRDGADPRKAAVFVARRIAHWKKMGFRRIVGVLGGNRSGEAWSRAALKVLKAEGCRAAFYGFDGVVAALSAEAAALGLGGAI